MTEIVKLKNTNNDVIVDAQVISRSDKNLVVYIPESDSRIGLFRTDTRRSYVGTLYGIEFTTDG